MPNKKIIYLDQKQLRHPAVASTLAEFPQHDWEAFLIYHRHTLYSRYGKNTFPLVSGADSIGWSTPAYDPNFKKTWADITNQRCQDLWKTHSNLPWLIWWSGGIDSTTVLTSILQNLKQQDFSNIHVACNFSSICENPDFFYKYVEPNFKVIDSTNLVFDQEILKTYIVIDGEPADQLFAGPAPQNLISSTNGKILTQDLRKSPDQLLKYLASDPRSNKHFAVWFYEKLLENIDSVDIPIHTYHDFFWWSYYNTVWTSVKFRNLNYEKSYNQNVLQSYLTNFIHWFDTDEYQLWSMNNNQFGIKYGTNISDYKLVAKQYIHNFDHNDYYLKFKMKTESASRPRYQRQWFCILDDLTRLNLNDDLEQILELLPAHIS